MLATTKPPISPLIGTSASIDKSVGDFVNLSAITVDKNKNTNTINMNQQVDHINTTATTTTSSFNKNVSSPDYNYFLDYSIESPMTTDSSTIPFSNNETANSNLYTSFSQKSDNNNTENLITKSNNNNNNDDKHHNKPDSAENIQLPVNNQLDNFSGSKDSYLANNPSNRSSPSISSSTTKLNTANNSTANLSKLNFRLNYVTSMTNSSDKTLSQSNNTHNPAASNENNRTNSSVPSTNSNIDGSTLTNDSPINNLSSPSVMNDLLELLDAKETEKQQVNSTSPLQQNNNILNTTAATISDNNKPFSFLDDSSPLTLQYNTENDFLQLDDVFENNALPINRRTSVVVNNKFPSLTKTRHSISHNVDFWNMNSKKSQEIDPSSMDIDPMNTEFSNSILSIDNNNLDTNSISMQAINDNVTQVLSGYNMDFSKDTSKSNNIIHDTSTDTTKMNDSNAIPTDFNNSLYSPKQNIPPKQITSIPFISESLSNSLYGNSTMNSNNNAQMLAVDNNNNIVFNPKFGIDDDNMPLSTLNNDDFNMTAFKNNLFDNDAIINENSSSMINNNILSTPGRSEVDNETFINNNVNEIFNQLNDTSMEKKFIKPSMMLSEKASIAAKLAVKGIPKVETFPTIDTQPYNHPTRITKRKSVSSIASNGSNIHKHAYTSTRRKSAVAVVKSSSAMTPNISIATATSKKNSLTSPTSGPHSADPENMEEKPFQCAECPKAFKRSEHLKRHIRSVHSNERPFPCTLCDKKFSRSDNLAQHLKTHKKHGDF